jgi:antitoxin ParD1/3/4
VNVSLSRKLEEYVRRKLESGMYASVSEIIREGLRLMQERDQIQEVRLQQLRRQVELGWQQAQSGRLKDGPAALRELLMHIEERPSRHKRSWK